MNVKFPLTEYMRNVWNKSYEWFDISDKQAHRWHKLNKMESINNLYSMR